MFGETLQRPATAEMISALNSIGLHRVGPDIETTASI